MLINIAHMYQYFSTILWIGLFFYNEVFILVSCCLKKRIHSIVQVKNVCKKYMLPNRSLQDGRRQCKYNIKNYVHPNCHQSKVKILRERVTARGKQSKTKRVLEEIHFLMHWRVCIRNTKKLTPRALYLHQCLEGGHQQRPSWSSAPSSLRSDSGLESLAPGSKKGLCGHRPGSLPQREKGRNDLRIGHQRQWKVRETGRRRGWMMEEKVQRLI